MRFVELGVHPWNASKSNCKMHVKCCFFSGRVLSYEQNEQGISIANEQLVGGWFAPTNWLSEIDEVWLATFVSLDPQGLHARICPARCTGEEGAEGDHIKSG